MKPLRCVFWATSSLGWTLGLTALPSCGSRTTFTVEEGPPPPPECTKDKDCDGFDDRCFPVACVANKCKDLTPVKLQMRLPGMVWGSIAMEAGLGRKRKVSLRHIQLAKLRTAARIGCPF